MKDIASMRKTRPLDGAPGEEGTRDGAEAVVEVSDCGSAVRLGGFAVFLDGVNAQV
jgi:hypothetical protein